MKTNDGLPEVAQQITKIQKIKVIVMMLTFILFIGVYFYTTSTAKQDQVLEETYAVQNDNLTESKALSPVVSVPAVEPKKEVVEPNPELSTEQIGYILEKEKELQQRLSAPLMAVNNDSASKGAEAAPKSSSATSDPNMQFMQQVSAQNVESATATSIGSLSTIIAEGSLIHATLESATNSDLPGFLRASVSQPVYSENGMQILIPRGSRLIGQYKSGMLQGQSRIFIVWTRLITPNGFSLNLGSPGVDSLGVAGSAADEIDRHFWLRFGNASLLSLLGAGTANVGVSGADTQNSASVYREAVASSFAQSASQSLEQESMIAPTLKTYQGKPIMVFVSRDLHFANAVQQAKPNINVF